MKILDIAADPSSANSSTQAVFKRDNAFDSKKLEEVAARFYQSQLEQQVPVCMNRKQMDVMFGTGRNLTARQTRELYHAIVHPLSDQGKQSLRGDRKKNGDSCSYDMQRAKMLSRTRQAARLYARSRASKSLERLAETRDRWVYSKGIEKPFALMNCRAKHGSHYAPGFPQARRRYGENAELIMEKSGSSNVSVDRLSDFSGMVMQRVHGLKAEAASLGERAIQSFFDRLFPMGIVNVDEQCL